jgi:TRAP-type C4-dicarboxylate transport system permease small subunit
MSRNKEILRIGLWSIGILGITAVGGKMAFSNPEVTQRILNIIGWISISVGILFLIYANYWIAQIFRNQKDANQGLGWCMVAVIYAVIISSLCIGIPLLITILTS